MVADIDNHSSVLKLKHAFELRDRFRDLLEELLNAPREIARRDNRSERGSRIVWAEWTLESAPEYTEASLLLGDVIHNLRAAMDHAVWAVTPADVRDKSPTDVAFPLHTDEARYDRWAAKRAEWYGAKVFEVLRYFQPFNAAGTGTLHPLHILQLLSNTDKHRLLNIVAHYQVDMGAVRVVPEPPGGVRSIVNDGPVTGGSVLARVEFMRPMEADAVDLKPTFAYQQVIRYLDHDGDERWLPIGEAMNAIGPDVVEAVGALLSAHGHDTAGEMG